MGEAPKYYGKRRSIVRRIGSFLPLRPPPKIYVSVTPLHSMTSSMINEETSSDYVDSNGYGPARSVRMILINFFYIYTANNILSMCVYSGRLLGSRPDLLEPISFGSEIRLLALEQELQELREQISVIVKSSKQSQCKYYVIFISIYFNIITYLLRKREKDIFIGEKEKNKKYKKSALQMHPLRHCPMRKILNLSHLHHRRFLHLQLRTLLGGQVYRITKLKIVKKCH